MEFGGAGTAIMIAIAAVLWFLYLMPTWMRHREERAAELAERRRLTVGVESAAVWRVEGEEDAPARVAPAAPEVTLRSAAPTVDLARVRQRRARRLAAGLLLASIAMLVVQGWILTTPAATVATWVLLAAAAGGVVLSVAVQRRLDARTRAAAGVAAPARRRRATPLQDIDLDEVVARAEDWTPVPVPKPLYLSRGEVRPARAGDAARELAAASAASEERLRSAERAPEVGRMPAPAARRSEVAAGLRAARDTPVAPAAQGAPGGARYAAMGLLDEAQLGGTDLDDVLARRRRVG